MRKLEFGFLNNKDIVPDIFCIDNSKKIREIFLTLYNANVDSDYKIPKKFAKNSKNLSQIFTNFINLSIQKKPLNFKKATKFCIFSNILIFNYLNGKKTQIYKFANLPQMKIAKILYMLSKNPNFGIVFNAKILFENFVFDKISHKNSDCEIYFKDDMVVIEKKGYKKLGIFINFEKIDISKQCNIDNDIKNAITNRWANEVDEIYLIYPKNDNFTKHIEIKSDNFKYNFMMKLVPYKIDNQIY